MKEGFVRVTSCAHRLSTESLSLTAVTYLDGPHCGLQGRQPEVDRRQNLNHFVTRVNASGESLADTRRLRHQSDQIGGSHDFANYRAQVWGAVQQMLRRERMSGNTGGKEGGTGGIV